ncbi:hypothetical protein DZC72_10390 [Maribacter algicola]|uniref:Uncharacterized protein n=1 Tax=Maribacter algicola TaxID=2498892 RepID=A0A426RGJ0_9FLAO|nr:hypothetical protein [Maribacter algicola]RRQ48127.1 hypothetical protein DZC72_10390 [Maribacter algicola]
MIKFFRKFRQQLLKENRFSKYLLYAIGEILLVVIGILIALQLDNWNDQQKRKQNEEEILFLIDKNLQSDSLALSIELQKAQEAITTTDRLLVQVSAGNYNDSLSNWLGKIVCFERFKSKSSAFEVLKAKGIEIISDNNIQQELISYYDESLYNVDQSLNDVESSFNIDWIPVIKSDFKDFQWRISCQPIDAKDFYTKPSSVTLIKLYQDNREGSVRRIQEAMDKISEIRNYIKSKDI